MCGFCGHDDCKLTKAEVIERGPIIWNNAYGIMRGAYDDMPQTYSFKGVPAYNSYSALIPDESDENPHAYMYYNFDEDEGCGEGWEYQDIENPLRWQTEKEFLERIGVAEKLAFWRSR